MSAVQVHSMITELFKKELALLKKTIQKYLLLQIHVLCEYTSHGHCGVIENGTVLNDPSLDLLVQTAVSQARAGADIIAPSNMMDGFVASHSRWFR